MKALSIRHPQVGDTQDHSRLPHSYFPCLDSRPGKNGAWQSGEVPFHDAARVQSFCREHNLSSTSFFQAAWAMVLRCYLGGPSVCFASDSSEMAEDASSATVSVCQIDFNEMMSVLDVMRGMDLKHLPSPSQPSQTQSSVHGEPRTPGVLPMNTSLVYREDDQSLMHRPVIQEYAHGGLNRV